MPAFNRHRRFLEDSTNFFNPCDLEYDPEHNPTGICIPNCAATCPLFCRITDWSSPPSSSPSPAFSPYSQTAPPAQNHQHLSFPIKISLIFLVATFSYTIYKFFTVWYRSRRRHRTEPPSFPENQETVDYDTVDHHIWYIRTPGLQLPEINAITIVKYSKGDGVVVGTDCTVCLSEFDVDETLRLLPNCKHAFHISCIDTWLRSHTNCPLCRAGIVDNTVHPPLPEQNSDVLGNPGETNLRVSGIEGDDREEASGSSVLTNGETDEEHLNGNSEFLLRSEDLPASNDRGIGFQSRDGGSEIELVKIEHRTDENAAKIIG